jgi:hypothetical protein
VKNREAVASAVLRNCLTWRPDTVLLTGVTAAELAGLAASSIDTCPKCGATAWVNIDCDLCLVATSLREGETGQWLK